MICSPVDNPFAKARGIISRYKPCSIFHLLWLVFCKKKNEVHVYQNTPERRPSQVVRAAWLWCSKWPEDLEFKAGLCHLLTGKLSTQKQMGTFLELGKDKAAKGERWAPPFISCAQDAVEALAPTATAPIRLWKTFTFLHLHQKTNSSHIERSFDDHSATVAVSCL